MKPKHILVVKVFALLLFSNWANAQFSVYGGISTVISRDLLVTPKSTSHSGYVTGLNLRMLDDGLCFLFTGEYGTFNLLASEEKSYFKGEKLTYLKGKVGLGFDLFHLTKNIKLRSKFQGNLLYVQKYKDSQVGATQALKESGYSELNEAIGGLSTGLGLTLGIFDIDFEYEYGFYNIYYARHHSTLNFYNLTGGIRF